MKVEEQTIKLKTLPKRHKTKKEGIYYKEVEQITFNVDGNIIDKKITDKVYLIRYWDNRKQRFITLGKHSAGIRMQYCINKRNEYINLSTNNELPPQIMKRIKTSIITLDSIANEHYDNKSKHNRSNHILKRMYENHIQPLIGDKDILSITFDDIENIQTKLAEKYSNKSVNNYLGELSSIYTTAIKKGIITINPMKRITRLKIDNIRDRYLKKNEIELLIKTVENDEQLLTFVLISLYTGARLGAVCMLNGSSIDFDLGRITMRDEKNFEDYFCHLKNQRLIKLLKKRILTVDKNEPLVYDGLTVNNLKDRIKRRLGKVLNSLFNDEHTTNKQKVVPHTLRHTFASHLAINGVSIYTIKSLLNHSDINQTMRYAKLAPDRGEEDIQKLYI